jgi:hypothetical protein
MLAEILPFQVKDIHN